MNIYICVYIYDWHTINNIICIVRRSFTAMMILSSNNNNLRKMYGLVRINIGISRKRLIEHSVDLCGSNSSSDTVWLNGFPKSLLVLWLITARCC